MEPESKIIKPDEFIETAKEYFECNKSDFGQLLKHGEKALYVSFESLAEHSIELADQLIDQPEETLQNLEIAMGEIEWIPKNTRLRFSSMSESQHIKIRNLRAKHLGKTVALEGIIRQASEVRPQVTNIKFECPSCGTIISVLQIDKEQKQPKRCACGRKGSFRELSKDMIDSQVIVIEESPDSLDVGGDQPKRLKIFLKNDLVDPAMEKRTTPGSKVKVIGVLKEIEIPSGTSKALTRFDLAVEANNVVPLEEDIDDIEITEEEEREILEISKRRDLVEFLGRSVAPSVWGNEKIKQALTLQLFGGVRRKRSDGSFCREQIHGLLVGDPGVAKSVIMKYLTEISYKSRYVSGKGASGVGLTATAVKDEMTKTWVLEAGAMVLANKGSLFIDEFEKMSEEDRSNLHEGMSIQTISVSKATIQATLNARTSILAAANPKFGRFDVEKPFASQINLSPSLLSRFDFIFVMRDIPEETRDSMIADKIFSEHVESEVEDILEKDMFKKYIAYAKGFHPIITEEVKSKLKGYYVSMRKRSKKIDGRNIIPIGARQLEGLIRFTEAAAKLRLRNETTINDANEAISVMENYLKEVGYDEENDTFDIDKVSGNSASQRSKIDMVKAVIKVLEQQHGKVVPIEKLEAEVKNNMTEDELEEVLVKIVRNGDAFRPRRGHIQLM